MLFPIMGIRKQGYKNKELNAELAEVINVILKNGGTIYNDFSD